MEDVTQKRKEPPWPKVDVHSAPTTAKEVFIKFGLLSTVRGIPRIFKARNKFLSSFWGIIVLFFLALSFYLAFQIIIGFLQFSTQQEQTIRLSQKARFPDITICSLQPFRSRKSLRRDNLRKAETIVNEYFYNVTKKISNETKVEYLESELKYYKGKPFTWERKHDFYYDDDFHDYNLDYEDYDYDGSGDEDDDYAEEDYYEDDEGVEVAQDRSRSKRAPRVHYILPSRPTYVDNVTMRNILMTTTGLFQNIESKMRRKLGHQKNIIDGCSFTIQRKKRLVNVDCKVTAFQYPQYFNCYTVSRPDQEGLVVDVDIKLFLDDDVSLLYPKHYTHDTDSQKHGVRVVVHESGTFPDVYQNGYDVPPGMAATFVLHTTRWNHMTYPYGNCSNERLVLRDQSNKRYRYLQHSCVEMCIQRNINEQCHCIDPSLITDQFTSTDPTTGSTLPFCGNITFNRETISSRLACMYDFRLNPPAECPCPLPCKRYEYTSTVDMAKWPHESFHLPLYQMGRESRNLSFPAFDKLLNRLHPFFYGFDPIAHESYSDSDSIITQMLQNIHIFQRNYVSITVTRPTFEVQYIVEKPAIELATVMSRVGGIMSFWLGITFITVMEFFEVLYDALYILCKGRKRKNKEEEEASEEIKKDPDELEKS